jgi:hypothetical protein
MDQNPASRPADRYLAGAVRSREDPGELPVSLHATRDAFTLSEHEIEQFYDRTTVL